MASESKRARSDDEQVAAETDQGSEECVVCFCSLERETKVSLEPCGHLYCRPCADNWTQERNSCSYCRQVVTEMSFDFDQDGQARESKAIAAPEPEEEVRSTFAMVRVARGVFLTRLVPQPHYELYNGSTTNEIEVVSPNGAVVHLPPGQVHCLPVDSHPRVVVRVPRQGDFELGPSIALLGQFHEQELREEERERALAAAREEHSGVVTRSRARLRHQ
ncbi:hypothetical protein HDE_01402 [Halotydeus destructor]|nr:hypothetical protein HDE_01402 [Halotydeus destructor]